MSTTAAVRSAFLLAALATPVPAQFEVGRLFAHDGVTGDRFGHSVAIDQDTIVVGAPGAQGAIGAEGAAYIFRLVQGSWIEEAKLVAPDASPYAGFGVCVDVSGNRVAIGAPNADGPYPDAGAVYVYRRTGSFPFSAWALQQRVTPSSPIFTGFGASVSISGPTLAVGHAFNVWIPKTVHVFSANGAAWTESVVLSQPPVSQTEEFGASISVDGAQLMVGAPQAQGGIGKVYAFELLGGAWVGTQALPSASPGGGGFGRDVALSGDVAAVGLPFYGGNNQPGAVATYRKIAGQWQLELLLPPQSVPAPQAWTGQSVATNGVFVLAGIAGSPQTAPTFAGEVLALEYGAGSWADRGRIRPEQPSQNAGFAFDVDVSGILVAVSAPLGIGLNPQSGTVLVYSLVPPPPTVYCTSKLSSAGCLPTIASTGVASATTTAPFTIDAQSIISNRFGLCFFGVSGRTAFPFQGGTLCVLPPTRRTASQNSGGGSGTCAGAYSFDFNALVRSGVYPDLVAGVMVNAQYWYRDPASPSTTGLTDALEFGIGF